MEWKNIPDYEELYQISDTCVVKRLVGWQCTKERIIKPYKRRKYLCVGLHKNGHKKSHMIHRLMLETFIGPCPKGKEGCHNDGNPENNLIENLRWDTRSANVKDSIKHNTRFQADNTGSKNHFAKLNEKQVRIIRWLLKENKLSLTEIAKIFGVHYSTIYDIKNNKTWKHIK